MTGGQWKRWRAAGTMVAARCDGNGDSDDKKYTRNWRLRADADGARVDGDRRLGRMLRAKVPLQ